MIVKINNLKELNNIVFNAGFGQCKSLVLVMNYRTLGMLTANFKGEYFSNFKETWNKKWEDPEWFARYNGIPMAIGNWLEDGEVDIKI